MLKVISLDFGKIASANYIKFYFYVTFIYREFKLLKFVMDYVHLADLWLVEWIWIIMDTKVKELTALSKQQISMAKKLRLGSRSA